MHYNISPTLEAHFSLSSLTAWGVTHFRHTNAPFKFRQILIFFFTFSLVWEACLDSDLSVSGLGLRIVRVCASAYKYTNTVTESWNICPILPMTRFHNLRFQASLSYHMSKICVAVVQLFELKKKNINGKIKAQKVTLDVLLNPFEVDFNILLYHSKICLRLVLLSYQFVWKTEQNNEAEIHISFLY